MRLAFFGCVLTGVLLYSGIAQAADTALAVASVQVQSIFELSLNRTDIDFGSMKPGTERHDIPATGIEVTAFSNVGEKWNLQVSEVSELRDGNNVIDNQNFVVML